MASILPSPHTLPPTISPTEIYHASFPSTSPIHLRISVGGAGQSGLLRALADAFIRHKCSSSTTTTTKDCAPFAIAWYATDTTASFNTLASNTVDLSITYHPFAERIALAQGIADRRAYAFRDHWMVVGPKTNPAKLPLPLNSQASSASPSVYDLFSQLFRAAVTTANDPHPVRFLSRYDKSAANIKESSLWASIGQTPWCYPYSTWYHRCVEFPFRALETAAKLGEYTLTDKGTWWSVERWIREGMEVFMVGGDDDEQDPLLNPAHVLVGTGAENKALANEFVDWLIAEEGGQRVVRGFERGGVVLYSSAPDEGREVGRSKL